MKMVNHLLLRFCFLISTAAVSAQSPPDTLKTGRTPADTLLYLPARDSLYKRNRVEVDAAFPGGTQTWYRYLNEHLRYPKQAKKEKREGRVEVQFIIDKDGKVTDARQTSGDPILGAELVRVISGSPLWTPATQDGWPVRAYRTQPITFKAPLR